MKTYCHKHHPGRWWHPYHLLVSLVAGLFFALGGLLYTVIGVFRQRPERARRLEGRRAISRGFSAFLKILTKSGLVKIDTRALSTLAEEKSLILAPNHPSLLDAVLIVSALPTTCCLMKAAVLESPFLGGGARWAGYISNDSGSGMVRAAAEELALGGHVLIFPEGTRTPQDCEKIGPFKGGFAIIAKKTQVPTQTIIIEPNQRYLGKGWRPWWLPLFPLVFVVRLGHRFDPPAPDDAVKPWLQEMEAYFHMTLR